MTGRCLFGFSGEKPFLLPDNEGVKMNTSPVRMDDLPLNRFHCRIAALTFGAHLTDGYVLGVIGYAIIQLTPAMQLTPFIVDPRNCHNGRHRWTYPGRPYPRFP